MRRLCWVLLLCCGRVFGGEVTDCPRMGQMVLPNGDAVTVQVAAIGKARGQGLSGVQDRDFGPRDAMLFWFDRDGNRRFVMRDMYFDLDMYSLDEQLRVLEVRRGMRAHPGKSGTPPMEVMKFKQARHIVEMRADSPLARRVEPGMQFKWVSQPALAEIGACGKRQDESAFRARGAGATGIGQ